MKTEILPTIKQITIDGYTIDNIDMSQLNSNIISAVFEGPFGVVEFIDGTKVDYTSLDDFIPVLDKYWKRREEAELPQRYINYAQKHLNAKAQERGYDDAFTISTYGDTNNEKFDTEAKAFKIWRSKVWEKGNQLLSEIQLGKREVPSKEEFLALLPIMVWP